MKLLKGSQLSLIKTQGLTQGSYPLYNLVGLSEGKVFALLNALENLSNESVLCQEMAEMIRRHEIVK